MSITLFIHIFVLIEGLFVLKKSILNVSLSSSRFFVILPVYYNINARKTCSLILQYILYLLMKTIFRHQLLNAEKTRSASNLYVNTQRTISSHMAICTLRKRISSHMSIYRGRFLPIYVNTRMRISSHMSIQGRGYLLIMSIQ